MWGGKEQGTQAFATPEREWSLKYIEYGSKNFFGGLTDLHWENKVIRQFVPVLETVAMSDYLISMSQHAFYFTPSLKLLKILRNHAVPVGLNKRDDWMVKNIFAEAAMSGKTNHRLHCNHQIPDKTTQVQTGHKSIGSLRVGVTWVGRTAGSLWSPCWH